jgi:hypothetical protein
MRKLFPAKLVRFFIAPFNQTNEVTLTSIPRGPITLGVWLVRFHVIAPGCPHIRL